MKSIIIYFSQTGNTKKIAEAIYSGMSPLVEQCDIFRIRDLDHKELVNYDLIGIGGPVHYSRETPNITDLIAGGMHFLEGKHAFAFCTHGTLPGNFIGNVVSALTVRGLTVVGWNNWFTSCFPPDIPKPYLTDGHPDEIDLKEAENFGKEIVQHSRRISLGETQLIPTLPKGREYDLLYPRTTYPRKREIVAANSIPIKVNKEKCKYPKCTLCIDNCPTNSIDLSKSLPLFMMTCYKCWFCEQICPTGAMEVDWESMNMNRSPHIKTYLVKVAEELESRGRFRRLVPLENIGWETPWYKFKPGHPRLKPLPKSSKSK
jgi:flavodoxin/NAD-dependent dihydropyrimidine dehydrogenase PreA subunit